MNMAKNKIKFNKLYFIKNKSCFSKNILKKVKEQAIG